MSRVGLTICIICGIQFFGLTLMLDPDFFIVWVYRYVDGFSEPIYIFISKKLLYFFTFGGAIVGAILGFLGKKSGYYLCFLSGFHIWYLPPYYPYGILGQPIHLITYFEAIFRTLHPFLIVSIGGIVSIIELRIQSEKKKPKHTKKTKIQKFLFPN